MIPVKANPSDATPNVRRLTLLSLPPLALHIVVVLAVALSFGALRRAGVERALDHVQVALLALSVAAIGALLVYLPRAGRCVPRLLVAGASLWLAASVAELLVRLPSLAPAAEFLHAARLALGVVALPLLLAAAWRAIRHRPERE